MLAHVKAKREDFALSLPRTALPHPRSRRSLADLPAMAELGSWGYPAK